MADGNVEAHGKARTIALLDNHRASGIFVFSIGDGRSSENLCEADPQPSAQKEGITRATGHSHADQQGEAGRLGILQVDPAGKVEWIKVEHGIEGLLVDALRCEASL